MLFVILFENIHLSIFLIHFFLRNRRNIPILIRNYKIPIISHDLYLIFPIELHLFHYFQWSVKCNPTKVMPINCEKDLFNSCIETFICIWLKHYTTFLTIKSSHCKMHMNKRKRNKNIDVLRGSSNLLYILLSGFHGEFLNPLILSTPKH